MKITGVSSTAGRPTGAPSWMARMSLLGGTYSRDRSCVFCATPSRPMLSRLLRSTCLAGLVFITIAPKIASAQCSASGTVAANSTVTCNGSQTARVGQGAGADNVSVTVNNGANISVLDTNAIALGNNVTITLGASGPVAGGSATNAPVVVQTTTDAFPTNGQYNDGSNTIDVGSNSRIVINRNASVIATGTQETSEAINPYGAGNTIVNYGLIQGGPSSAINFQDVDSVATSPRNVVDNFGTIQLLPVGAVNPGTSGQAITGSGVVGIDFINETGAKVIGNLLMPNGDDNVTLNPGSSISGDFDGGGGNNLLTLNASGTSSDVIAGQVKNFETLNKTGSGTWTLTGAIGDNSGGGGSPLSVSVIAGTLALTGNNTAFNGSVVINPGSGLTVAGPNPTATLEARAQSLPPLITDHGILLVNQVSPDGTQSADGVYAGVIQGTGVVTKIGVGTVTLSGVNSYSGGTNLDVGAIAVAADSALGNANGPLTFNGGTLRLLGNFNIAATRSIVLNAAGTGLAGGGTIDTNGFQTTIAQSISGAGGLAKAGNGQLTLIAANSFSGGTTIAAGTLQLGNGGTTGGIVGNVLDGGTLSFDRSDAVTFGGVISGVGGVAQAGAGMTTLISANSYTGGTSIQAGTLQLGAGGAVGGIVGDVADNGRLAFDRSDTVTFSGAISGAGSVAQIGSGATILDNANSYSGVTTIAAGTLAVGDASHIAAALSGAGDVDVAVGANLGGYGTVAGNVTDNGVVAAGNALPVFAASAPGTFAVGGLSNQASVNLAGPSIGNTLIVHSNYSSANGTLTINTLLNAGGPLSNQVTDRLLIDGSANGSTLIHVLATGAGAATSAGVPTAADGISIVQVGGASSSGAFALAGGYVTNGTPFQYHLNAYGPGSVNGAAAANQSLVGNPGGQWDYRLQTAYVAPTGPAQPPVTVPITTPATSPTGPRAQVAPQVPSYITMSTALFNAGSEELDSLHRRLGEIRDNQQLGQAADSEVFVRGLGGETHYSSDRSFNNYGYNASQDYAATQFGANRIVVDDDRGTMRVGLAGTIGKLNFTPSAVDGASRGRFDTETLAGIATWLARSGWYVDAIVSGGLFDGRIMTPARGQVAGMNGTSISASIESGYPIPLGWQDVVLEPQTQLIYQHLDFARRTDIDGIDVNAGSLNQGIVRVGGRVTKQFATDDGALLTPYLKANLLQGIVGGDSIRLSGVPFETGRFGRSVQIGAGVTGTLTPNFSLYSDAAWQTNVGDGGSRGWTFSGGLRDLF